MHSAFDCMYANYRNFKLESIDWAMLRSLLIYSYIPIINCWVIIQFSDNTSSIWRESLLSANLNVCCICSIWTEYKPIGFAEDNGKELGINPQFFQEFRNDGIANVIPFSFLSSQRAFAHKFTFESYINTVCVCVNVFL